ncbi:hypothetical protein BN1013_02131 [Candidatus Rubidus massiliensis]|nr:hypothetical protein BN1013_02131 [Candidatus Rubidus massiliensis]
MFVVGAILPFPGWFFQGRKNEYNNSTLLMSLVDKKHVTFFLISNKLYPLQKRKCWMVILLQELLYL